MRLDWRRPQRNAAPINVAIAATAAEAIPAPSLPPHDETLAQEFQSRATAQLDSAEQELKEIKRLLKDAAQSWGKA
jgi:hypothetical protein